MKGRWLLCPMPDFPLIEHLYKALNSPHGVVISTTNVERLRAKLYTERKKDPDLSRLSINVSRTSPETEIWIIKK